MNNSKDTKNEKIGNLVHIVNIFARRIEDSEIHYKSVIIAFYMLLSVFPLLILVGNLIPLFNLDVGLVIKSIKVIIPEPLENLAEPILFTLLTSSSGGLLSAGFIGLVWSASKGINVLRVGLNKIYGVKHKSNFIIKRIISLVVLLGLILGGVAVVVVFTLGSVILDYITPHFSWALPLRESFAGLRWPLVVVFLFVMLIIIYTITPDVRLHFKELLPGTVVGTTGLILLAQGFGIFIRYSTNMFSLYGTLSAFFMLMFWMNFSVMIILFGAVVNVSIIEYKIGIVPSNENSVRKYLGKFQERAEHLAARFKIFDMIPKEHEQNTDEENKDKSDDNTGES